LKFGFVLPNYGDKISSGELLEIARVCEETGFDSVWATDHVIMPKEQREPYGQLLEPMVTLSFVAAATEKLKLGTSSIVLPQRNPILVAKQAAALDVFSGGRVILGMGIGWAEREFGYLGADFKKRASMMEESVRLMRALWAEETVNFQGKRFKVEDGIFLPKPVQGQIPIWIAGNSDGAVQRAIRIGDGWHPVGLDVERFRAGADAVAKSGKRVTLSLRVTVDVRKKRENLVGHDGEKRVSFSGSADEIRSSLEAYQMAGMNYCCASILHPSAADIVADIKKFGSEIISSYG
jgi:probable F420-dependent oxidoreductase